MSYLLFQTMFYFLLTQIIIIELTFLIPVSLATI